MGEQAGLATGGSQLADSGGWDRHLQGDAPYSEVYPIRAGGFEDTLNAYYHPLSFLTRRYFPGKSAVGPTVAQVAETHGKGVGGVGLGHLL